MGEWVWEGGWEGRRAWVCTESTRCQGVCKGFCLGFWRICWGGEGVDGAHRSDGTYGTNGVGVGGRRAGVGARPGAGGGGLGSAPTSGLSGRSRRSASRRSSRSARGTCGWRSRSTRPTITWSGTTRGWATGSSTASPRVEPATSVEPRERLGGILRSYHRAAWPRRGPDNPACSDAAVSVCCVWAREPVPALDPCPSQSTSCAIGASAGQWNGTGYSRATNASPRSLKEPGVLTAKPAD
jgi:hypothetical protein